MSKKSKMKASPATKVLKEQSEAEVKRQRKLVKEVLYDFLLKNSTSIEDAKNVCYATSIAVQQAFHNKIAEKQKELSREKLSVLELEGQMVKSEETARFKDFVALLSNESISTASALLEGLKQVIESFEREEATQRPLDSLKATFLD